MVRWGIVGCGQIAQRFVQGLAHVDEAMPAAVWSRRPDASAAFAAACGARAAPSFEALLAAPVDAVYVATLHDSHAHYAIAALRAGKAVLCEKPAATSAAELRTVLATARHTGGLFMEAMKPPFYPLYRKLRAHLDSDPIGRIVYVRAGGADVLTDSGHPTLRPEAAGGALLAIGIYEAFLALDWLGPATAVQTLGRIGPSGVDTFASINSAHARGIAQLHCGIDCNSTGEALLAGTAGNVTIHARWWNPTHATVRYADGRTVALEAPFTGGGLNYETGHFCDLLREGRTESPVMPHALSLGMIEMLDEARAALGVRVPFEA
jgi:predicted dehydrogenase